MKYVISIFPGLEAVTETFSEYLRLLIKMNTEPHHPPFNSKRKEDIQRWELKIYYLKQDAHYIILMPL